MRHEVITAALVAFFGVAAAASAAMVFQSATAQKFDPRGTELVQAAWLRGLGCPTGARIATFDAAGRLVESTFTDPACPTGDAQDRHNEGVLLAKTGPTANFAAALVILNEVPETVTELGYDIRKPGASADPRGSHCGAGAPRFNVETEEGQTIFIGCNSPPAPVQQVGTGWLRLRWGGGAPLLGFSAQTGQLVDVATVEVERIVIVFDEGQDASGGPDQSGLAVLDNIDVNGTLVGRGSTEGSG